MSFQYDDRLPLSRHFLFSTTDPDEARTWSGRIWCETRFTPRQIAGAPWAGFRMDVHHAALIETSLSYVETRGALFLASDTLDSFLAVVLPLAGASEHQVNRQAVQVSPARGVLYSAPHRFYALTEGATRQLVLRINRAALEGTLAALIGRRVRRPVEFAPGVPLDAGVGPALQRLTRFLCSELDSPDSLLWQSRLALREAERTLMVLLLDGQPHNYSDDLHRDADAAAPWLVRVVEEYVEANLDRPLSIADLAQVGGVSARTLNDAFRHHRGSAPMQFVRRLRLERAREKLIHPDGGTTVTAVADRWGFCHMGRFADSYQRQFGESPSETLKRGRQPEGLRAA